MGQFNYRVVFEDFAKRHYVKKFLKKYKDKWVAKRDAKVEKRHS